ncbi:uncharacterized protein DUF4998 [Dyadobacter jejuensis]|uniref:Uncharacterized protein DUF4998 n=1 Tax=Dyadobacter jejuensis TaxID=1082580 RepID=A0A316B5M9_9BACT|nr:DUF4998 domain-containing protein [Dyadobacter jejuensis]PWJ57947.1 uncharacterized protein DUF4998 [Dyadobacter jejuensis]
MSIYNQYKKWSLPIFLLLLMAACTSLEDTFSEFSKVPESTYVGTADTIITQSGFEKVRFAIVYNADPKITKGELKILNDTLTHRFTINRKHNGTDTAFVDLAIHEGTYRFVATLMDDSGNKSLEKSILVNVLGESFVKTLLPKEITGVKFQKSNLPASNGALVSFGKNHEGLKNVRLLYQDAAGNPQEVWLGKFNTTILLNDFKPASKLIAQTIYEPTNPFNEFMPETVTEVLLPKCNGLSTVSSSTERLTFPTTQTKTTSQAQFLLSSTQCIIDKLSVTATAPFQVSLAQNGPFTASVTIDSNVVNKPIYVSFKPVSAKDSTFTGGIKVSATNVKDSTLVVLSGYEKSI